MSNSCLDVFIATKDTSRIFEVFVAKASTYVLEVKKKQWEISEIGRKDEYTVGS
jgi:hypothetical protein